MSDDQSIDWKAIWQDLDWDNPARQEEVTRQRLSHRARQYAALVSEAQDDARLLTVLTFDLGTERYAVDVMQVRGVRTLPHVTPVPGIPPFYRGVVNLRGQIITVMDLRIFFGLPADDQKLPGELVIARANDLELGLLTHHVRGVESLSTQELEPLGDVRYARGVTASRTVLLDIAAIFGDERLVIGGGDE